MKQQTHTNIKNLSDRGLTSGVLNFNDSLKSHQYKTSGIIVILLKAVSKFDRSRSYENVIVYLFGTCIENKSTGIYHHVKMMIWQMWNYLIHVHVIKKVIKYCKFLKIFTYEVGILEAAVLTWWAITWSIKHLVGNIQKIYIFF